MNVFVLIAPDQRAWIKPQFDEQVTIPRIGDSIEFEGVTHTLSNKKWSFWDWFRPLDALFIQHKKIVKGKVIDVVHRNENGCQSTDIYLDNPEVTEI